MSFFLHVTCSAEFPTALNFTYIHIHHPKIKIQNPSKQTQCLCVWLESYLFDGRRRRKWVNLQERGRQIKRHVFDGTLTEQEIGGEWRWRRLMRWRWGFWRLWALGYQHKKWPNQWLGGGRRGRSWACEAQINGIYWFLGSWIWDDVFILGAF